MQSLTDLNTRAAAPIAFTDNRGANVIFDRAAGKTYSFTETTQTFNALVGGNILEIINPNVANVRYQINVDSLGTTLDFGTLPPGVTVAENVGTVYTVYGIKTLAHWEAVKQPTITIDPDFEGTFSYTAKIIYNTDSAANVEFDWFVGYFIPAAQMLTQFDIQTTVGKISDFSANLVMNTSWQFTPVELAVVMRSAMTTDVQKVAVLLSDTSDQTYIANFKFLLDAPSVLEPQDTFTYTITPSDVNAVENIKAAGLDETIVSTRAQSYAANGYRQLNDDYYLIDQTLYDWSASSIRTYTGYQSTPEIVLGKSYVAIQTGSHTFRIETLSNATTIRSITVPSSNSSNGNAISLRSCVLNDSYIVISTATASLVDNNGGRMYIYNIATGSLVNTISGYPFTLVNIADNHNFAYQPDYPSSTNTRTYHVYSITSNSELWNKTPATGFHGGTFAINSSIAVIGFPQTIGDGNADDIYVTDGLEYTLTAPDFNFADGSGKVIVYDVTTGTQITEIANPNAFDTVDMDAFGTQVALGEAWIAVGAAISDSQANSITNGVYTTAIGLAEDENGQMDSGKVYVFNSFDYSLQKTLNNPNTVGTAAFDYYGDRLVSSNNRLAVFTRSNPVSGTAEADYVYTYTTSAADPAFALNAVTKVVTLTGNNAVVNNILGNTLIFTPKTSYTSNFTLTYKVTRSDGEFETVTRNITNI